MGWDGMRGEGGKGREGNRRGKGSGKGKGHTGTSFFPLPDLGNKIIKNKTTVACRMSGIE